MKWSQLCNATIKIFPVWTISIRMQCYGLLFLFYANGLKHMNTIARKVS